MTHWLLSYIVRDICMSPFHSDLYLLVLAKRGHNVGILLPLVDAWPSHGLPYGISKFLSQNCAGILEWCNEDHEFLRCSVFFLDFELNVALNTVSIQPNFF